jgi:hypothetical protein
MEETEAAHFPDAVQRAKRVYARERAIAGAPLIRDRPKRSRVCGASLHAAPRPGNNEKR